MGADAPFERADPANFLMSGCSLVVSAGLTQPIAAGQATIAGAVVAYAGESRLFDAWADTYRDLKPDGTLVFSVVERGDDPGPVAAGSLRIGFTTTNGIDVINDTILAETVADLGPVYDIPLT